MKKTILFAALLASTATFAIAQDGGPESEEPKNAFPPQENAPKFGGPGPMFGDAFKDGKIEIAKLPEQTPQEHKDKMKAADKDGDGFLTRDEMKELAPKFEKPAFLAEDGKIDVAKLTEALKAADKNGDGFIDQDERKNALETAQKKFGPMFFARLTQTPAPFAPQWGAPQPWGAWPKADWNRGPRRDGDRPQADWNRGPRRDGDRPQADWNRGPRRDGDRPQPDWNRGPRRDGDRPRGDQPKPEKSKNDSAQGSQDAQPEAPKAE